MKTTFVFLLSLGMSSMVLAQGKHFKNKITTDTEITESFENSINPLWKNAINDNRDNRREMSVSEMTKTKDSPIQFSKEVAREGTYSLKMSVQHQLGQFRSEVAFNSVPMNSEYWYGFSIYLPSDWQTDQQGNILAQWHARMNVDRQQGDGTGQPPVAISVQGNSWAVKLHYNTDGPSFSGAGKGNQQFDGGAIEKAKWTDFVVHAKWAFTQDGFLEVWKNGQNIVDYKGPTSYVNKVAPYFKMGIYHPNWKSFKKDEFDKDTSVTKPIVVYDDAVRIRKAPANYQEVAPRND